MGDVLLLGRGRPPASSRGRVCVTACVREDVRVLERRQRVNGKLGYEREKKKKGRGVASYGPGGLPGHVYSRIQEGGGVRTIEELDEALGDSGRVWFQSARPQQVTALLLSLGKGKGKTGSGRDARSNRRSSRCSALLVEEWARAHNLDGRLDSVHYTALIGIAGKRGDTSRVMELWSCLRASEILGTGMCPTEKTFSVYVQALGHGGRWERAVNVLEKLRYEGKVRGNKYAYAAVLRSCAEAGEFRTAQRVFSDMVRDGCDIDVVSASSLVEAFGKGGEWRRAEELVRWMSRRGVYPNVVTYTSLIVSLGNAGQWQRVIYYFDEMQRQNAEPNQHAISAVITALVRSNQKERALELYRKMVAHKVEMNGVTYGAVMSCLAQQGLYDECWSVLQRLRQANIEVGCKHYNMLMASAIRGKRWSYAVQAFQEMEDVGVRPSRTSYETLMRAYSTAGKAREVRLVLEEMTSKGMVPSCYAYVGLICAHEKAGEHRAAVSVLEEMRVAGVEPNVHVINAVLVACCNGRLLDTALRIVNRMGTYGIEPNGNTRDIMSRIGKEGVEAVTRAQTASGLVSVLATASAYGIMNAPMWIDKFRL